MIEVKGTIVGNTIQSSEIDSKETVVGSLGNTKQSMKGSTNVSGFYMKEYVLPIGSEEELGGIKIGDNLNIEEDGRLSATGVTSYNDLTDKPTIPAKISDLENDSGYLAEIPEEYITEEELASKGYLTSVPDEYKTKEENDALYQPIGDYAYKEDIPTVPTKVSELENDSGFISSIPEEYVTETELNNSLSGKANKSDIPTKTSQLTNDSGFLTEHQDISHLATKDELHTHSNKAVLDSISQEKLDKWNAGSRNVVLSPSEPTLGEEIWFQKSVNLFNKEAVTNGYWIKEDGTYHNHSQWYVSDYIPVISGEKYTYSGFKFIPNHISDNICHAYYDSDKKLVSTFLRDAKTGTLIIPSGVSYIRFSVYRYSVNDTELDDLSSFQFEKGSTASEYQPYADGEKIYTKTKDGYEEFEVGSSGGVVEESDPTVPAHVKTITQSDIAKWNSGGGSSNVVLSPTEPTNGEDIWFQDSVDTYIDVPNTIIGESEYGITGTSNEDGSITLNGTSTGLHKLYLIQNQLFKKGTYTLSSNISTEGYNLVLYNETTPKSIVNSAVVPTSTIEVETDSLMSVYFFIPILTLSNETINIQLKQHGAKKIKTKNEYGNYEEFLVGTNSGTTIDGVSLSNDMIKVDLTANYEYTLTGAWKRRTVPFDKVSSQIGTGFSLTPEGRIKIGAGISKISINASALILRTNKLGTVDIGLRLFRNGTTTHISLAYHYLSKLEDFQTVNNIVPLYDVQENDEIEMNFTSDVVDTFRLSTLGTFISISKINETNVITGSVEDSGWLDAEIVSTSGTWSRFKYRKIGNRVRIEGRVSNLEYNGSEYTIGKIPTEYAPTSTINTYGFTSKNIIARFVVNASGEIKFSWNLNMSTDSDNKNASWYNFDFEYLTD